MNYMNMNIKWAVLSIALVLGASPTVMAQSSSGNITGQATAGETVVVRGDENGFHRTIKVEKSGKFSIRRVPTGNYTVVKMNPDGSASSAQTITVRVGSTARVQ